MHVSFNPLEENPWAFVFSFFLCLLVCFLSQKKNKAEGILSGCSEQDAPLSIPHTAGRSGALLLFSLCRNLLPRGTNPGLFPKAARLRRVPNDGEGFEAGVSRGLWERTVLQASKKQKEEISFWMHRRLFLRRRGGKSGQVWLHPAVPPLKAAGPFSCPDSFLENPVSAASWTKARLRSGYIL